MDKKEVSIALKWAKGELSYKDACFALGFKTYRSGSPYIRLALALKEHINKLTQKK